MQKGFTLLEILIAMAIFTLIGVASTAMMTTVIDSNTLSEARFDKLQQLQRAMLIIERDIQQAVPRAIRVEGEVQEVVMAGGDVGSRESEGDGLGFVRGGWHNPQHMLPRSTLQYVVYRLKENRLERLHSNYVDNVVGHEPTVRVLLENVEGFEVEFVEPDKTITEDDHGSWVERYQGNKLPQAVAIEIDSIDFGLLRREFTLSGGA